MKVLNINIHFYPQSYGGATIVAEKAAYGMIANGHKVTNVAICIGRSEQTYFDAIDTPFGTTFFINHIKIGASTRYHNPAAASALRTIIDIVDPDRIILHAPQHFGILDLLGNEELLARTTIVAHDFFWVCLQGFKTLPNGNECTRAPSGSACLDCVYYTGLIESDYLKLRQILDNSRNVIFPSQFLADQYHSSLGRTLPNARVLANPDQAENVISIGDTVDPVMDQITVGYFGGPGVAKGWDIVNKLMTNVITVGGKRVQYALIDGGERIGQPWYKDWVPPSNCVIWPSFHWTSAADVLSRVDVVVAFSKVNESFGLIAREALSLGKRVVIYPSGALAELEGHQNVYVARRGKELEALVGAISDQYIDGVLYAARDHMAYAEELLR